MIWKPLLKTFFPNLQATCDSAMWIKLRYTLSLTCESFLPTDPGISRARICLANLPRFSPDVFAILSLSRGDMRQLIPYFAFFFLLFPVLSFDRPCSRFPRFIDALLQQHRWDGVEKNKRIGIGSWLNAQRFHAASYQDWTHAYRILKVPCILFAC